MFEEYCIDAINYDVSSKFEAAKFTCDVSERNTNPQYLMKYFLAYGETTP